MAFEPVRCACGCIIIYDYISATPGGDKPCVRIAIATICPRCTKIYRVCMADRYKGKVQLCQVEKLYRATRLNNFSEEELRTGYVRGFNVPGSYNPDAHLEPETEAIW